jgi:hypothetical protein
MHFSPSFFHWAKPMPSGTRSLGFSNSRMIPSPRQVSSRSFRSTAMVVSHDARASTSRSSLRLPCPSFSHSFSSCSATACYH